MKKAKTNIDLHIHSREGSDGHKPIDEILKIANQKGMSYIAISDHDNLYNFDEVKSNAKSYGISVIPGIEFSINLYEPEYSKNGELHILAYGFDPQNQELLGKVKEIQNYRIGRIQKIVSNLNPLLERDGFESLRENDISEILKLGNGSVGRPHVADYLIQKGVIQSRKEAFNKYLYDANSQKYELSPKEIHNLVNNAGGFLVLAHPNAIKNSLRIFSDDLKEQGKIIEKNLLDYIKGIECWSTKLDSKSSEFYSGFCNRHNLLSTIGSDCHQNPVFLGSLDVPADAQKNLIEKIKRYVQNE